MDAALASLRLSVEMTNMLIQFNSSQQRRHAPFNDSIRLSNQSSIHPNEESWIQLRIYSCSYHDVGVDDNTTTGTRKPTTTTLSYRTKMHKALTFHDRITIVTGDRRLKQQQQQQQQEHEVSSQNNTWSDVVSRMTSWNIASSDSHTYDLIDENVSMIVMFDTLTTSHHESNMVRERTHPISLSSSSSSSPPSHQISIRVIEYDDENNTSDEASFLLSNDDKITQKNVPWNNQIQQDISIQLNQSVHMSMDTKSLEQIQTVINSFMISSTKSNSHPTNNVSDTTDDEHE
jgi:hypothetical protein